MRYLKFMINIATSLLFILAVLMPSITMFATPDQEISKTEQRTLNQLPENINPFSQPFEQFATNMEGYINDQFGYRDRLIHWYNYIKVVGLHKSPTEKVIIGKNKWLFLTQPNQIEDHQGLSILSDQELSDWNSLFVYRQQWLAERDIMYILVIAPDKKSIYPEYYPSQYPIIHENNTQLDQLLAYMRENSDLIILDLREPLLTQKKTYPDSELLYYKSDTHWTQTGAFVAYQWMIMKIQEFFPDLIPFNEELLIFRPLANPLHDNQSIIGMADENIFSTTRYAEICFRDSINCNELTEDNECQEVDYKMTYLNLSARQYSCKQKSVNSIIFFDSFGLALYPYLVRTFENSILIRRTERFWLISDEFELLLNDTQPDIIIEEMIERTFTNPPHPSRLPPIQQ